MTRSSHRRFVVYCILSAAAMGCAEKRRIIDSGLVGAPHPSSHSLIDGDHLALKLQVPEDRRPVSVGLARVTWAQGNRFGVELLMIDADEQARLMVSSKNTFPPNWNFTTHIRNSRLQSRNSPTYSPQK